MNPKPGTDQDVVRRALDSLRNQTRRKNHEIDGWEREILEASKAGASLRQIAEAAELNHQAVANRLKNERIAP